MARQRPLYLSENVDIVCASIGALFIRCQEIERRESIPGSAGNYANRPLYSVTCTRPSCYRNGHHSSAPVFLERFGRFVEGAGGLESPRQLRWSERRPVPDGDQEGEAVLCRPRRESVGNGRLHLVKRIYNQGKRASKVQLGQAKGKMSMGTAAIDSLFRGASHINAPSWPGGVFCL